MYVLKMQKHQHQIGQAWKKKFIYLWDNGTDIHIGKSSYLFHLVIFNLIQFFLIELCIHCWVSLCCCLSSSLLISSHFFSFFLLSHFILSCSRTPSQLCPFFSSNLFSLSLFSLPNLLLFILFYLLTLSHIQCDCISQCSGYVCNIGSLLEPICEEIYWQSLYGSGQRYTGYVIRILIYLYNFYMKMLVLLMSFAFHFCDIEVGWDGIG